MALALEVTLLFDLSEEQASGRWEVVNDGVMGGLSRAAFRIDEAGTGHFSGQVSLENNGGFASLRYRMEPVAVQGHKSLVVQLKGDGKNYQLRIRENSSDDFAYVKTIATTGEWETVKVPLGEMYPSFRGQKLNRPHYQGNRLSELTFLIANQRDESFRLLLKKAFLQ